MIEVIRAAHALNCPKWSDVARAVQRNYKTVHSWRAGRSHIPAHCRTAFERALGAEIDWTRYEAEYSALLDQKRRAAPPCAPNSPPLPPDPPDAPETPVTRPLSAPPPAPKRRGWFDGIILGGNDDE